MTPRQLIRQNGMLVDSNNEPLEGRLKELKRAISSADGDHSKKEELEEQLNQLYQEAKVLIDLRGKLLVFLEPSFGKLDNTAYSYWQDETGNKAIADTVLRAILQDPNGKIIQSYIGNEDDKSYMILFLI